MSLMFFLIRKVFLSSANKKNFKIFQEALISFILRKKRIGSSMLPCRTANAICILSDKVVPLFTTCCLTQTKF